MLSFHFTARRREVKIWVGYILLQGECTLRVETGGLESRTCKVEIRWKVEIKKRIIHLYIISSFAGSLLVHLEEIFRQIGL